MGKQFPARAYDFALQQNNPLRFLLLETSPSYLKLEVILKQYSCMVEVDRVHWVGDPAKLKINWQHYNLILIDNSEAFLDVFAWLGSIKQLHDIFPIIVALPEKSRINGDGVFVAEGAASCSRAGDYGSLVTAKLDTALELAVALHQYPIYLPNWQMLEVLHDSENAIVFLAQDPGGIKIALKRFKLSLHGVGEKLVLSFLANAQTLRSSPSQHLVKVIDAGVVGQTAYLTMEYVQGTTLRQLLVDSVYISVEQRIRWFLQVTEALICLHDLGLLHRDLKSSNVMICEDQSAVLVDLGVEAQLLLASNFLGEYEIYCTPFYVSPERISGAPATVQSDLYSLGVLLFELLTGEKPLAGGTLADILQAHLFEPVPVLPEELSDFQGLLNDLMAKLPENRPASTKEVLAYFQHEI